jgi:hypothetical protein
LNPSKTAVFAGFWARFAEAILSLIRRSGSDLRGAPAAATSVVVEARSSLNRLLPAGVEGEKLRHPRRDLSRPVGLVRKT